MNRLKTLFRAVRWRRVLMIALLTWILAIYEMAAAIYLYSKIDQKQPADVIIVLGAGLKRDGSAGPALVRRATYAAGLWRAGYAPKIICAGGYAMTAIRSEADGCRDILLENGVPDDVIILEDRSRSTHENAVYTHEIMRVEGFANAVLVSDGYHLLRASWIFAAEGITFYPSPCPRGLLRDFVPSVAREVVALHWQALVYIFHLPFTFVPWL